MKHSVTLIIIIGFLFSCGKKEMSFNVLIVIKKLHDIITKLFITINTLNTLPLSL